jgi:hypothetical protein
MKTQNYFLIAAAINILLIIGFTLYKSEDFILSQTIFNSSFCILQLTYAICLYSLIWVIFKSDKNYKLIIPLGILIADNISAILIFILSKIFDFQVNVQVYIITGVLTLLPSIYFIYQTLISKSKIMTFEFKLIGFMFLTKIVFSISSAVLNAFSLQFDLFVLNQLASVLEILSIIFLLIKSIKTIIPNTSIEFSDHEGIILDSDSIQIKQV